MSTDITRSTIIWFVGAVIAGVAAGGLHLLVSTIGGGNPSTVFAVAAWVLTALTAVMVYRGIMTAAGEQDAAARRRPAQTRARRGEVPVGVDGDLDGVVDPE